MRTQAARLMICWFITMSGSFMSDAVAVEGRDFALEQVAEIYPNFYRAMTFGDTDHDGKGEVIVLASEAGEFGFRIQEEQGDNIYLDECSGPFLIPYATGDLDGDGRGEIIGQTGMYIQIYESPDDTSHPSILVWTSPPLNNIVGYTTVGDTDRDGRMEIIHSVNGFSGWSRLIIFENTGDNTYTQVYETNVGDGDFNGEKVVADLDNDGRIEIAMGGGLGVVYVYESDADDSWNLVWTHADGPLDGFAVEGGRDTNGNGIPEFFVAGMQDTQWITEVFEATGDNQFALVGLLRQDDGYSGLPSNVLADLDGIPPDEYVMRGAYHFWIYRHQSGVPGWSMIQEFDDPGVGTHFDMYARDVNGNGRDEIFWGIEGEIDSDLRTLVLEHPIDPASVEDTGIGVASGIAPTPGFLLSPNPFHGETRIRWSDEALGGDARRSTSAAQSAPAQFPEVEAVSIVVFDATGRAIESTQKQLWPESGVGWRPESLAPGTYWVRLRSVPVEVPDRVIRVVVR
ncbi:FG-GAP repeat domain-containing protein [Candidatus Eisenbacteria bacterium]|uniref:FG-GAP repeat domain-containing protein n=1 Tax=Eiseniibacteriota bacterium TaxID=2212470 RepID=A0ABV6YJZ9_UNCEI